MPIPAGPSTVSSRQARWCTTLANALRSTPSCCSRPTSGESKRRARAGELSLGRGHIGPCLERAEDSLLHRHSFGTRAESATATFSARGRLRATAARGNPPSSWTCDNGHRSGSRRFRPAALHPSPRCCKRVTSLAFDPAEAHVPAEFDVIVVGAGSAGATLAARLSRGAVAPGTAGGSWAGLPERRNARADSRFRSNATGGRARRRDRLGRRR